MVFSATPPPADEQAIEQRLVVCGLSRDGFSVKYENYLQSIEIVIEPAAGAREDHFPCIRQAVQHGIVSFADTRMQRAYSNFEIELFRPQMLEIAKAELKKLRLLKNFPDPKSYANLELYAEALEQHSGLMPRSRLRVSGTEIVVEPPSVDSNFEDLRDRYSSLMAVLMFASARGDADFWSTGSQA
jgi:hypothetical protein